MPKRSISLLCLSLAGSLIWIACGFSPPAQKSEAAPVLRKTSSIKAVPDPRTTIVAFGDSLTAGYGADPGRSYPDFLQHLLDQNAYRYRVLNAGVSGDTTTDGLERLSDVVALHAPIVILELGGNDGLRGIPVATIKANLEQMIVALQQSGSTVLLAGITLPRNYGPDYVHAFDKIYVDLASQYHLTRIPFLLQGVAGVSNLMQTDSIHPTAQGNAIVARGVFQYLRPLLKKSAV